MGQFLQSMTFNALTPEMNPYTHLSGLAPKERQSLAQGVSPWDSLLCVFVSLWWNFSSVSWW